MKTRADKDGALLVEVLMALGRADLIEQVLVDIRKTFRDNHVVYGATLGKKVYINPLHHQRRADVVSTLLHEGVHRCRPHWKERSVINAERRLMRIVTDEQIDAVFKVYEQAVRQLRGTRKV